MPRPRPPYLQRQRTRHGAVVWYFRKYPGPRIRIRAEFGTAEFEAAYQAALTGVAAAPAVAKTKTGSVKWLWERYKDSADWAALAGSTRRARENIMVGVLEKIGAEPCGSIRKSDMVASIDARAKTPAQANAFLTCQRKFWEWASNAYPDQVRIDPTASVKGPRRKKGAGHIPWDATDCAKYEKHWPIGTRQRVWYEVVASTGFRRGDAVTAGKQHVKEIFDQERETYIRCICLKTEKGGHVVEVIIPIAPDLDMALAAGPCGDLAFICGARGQPLDKATFGNEFRKACDAAGVFGKSAHGLRKTSATEAADAGATDWELDSRYGWTGGKTSAIYTKAANRKRLALRAAAKVASGTPGEPSIPSPHESVRVAARKTK